MLLSACAPTAAARFGDVARYAPARAGYVMGAGDAAVLLRDPVTGEKLRCREDVERLAPALAGMLEDEARDRHAAAVAPVAVGPFTLAGRAAQMMGDGLFFPAAKFDELVASPQPRQVYTRARAAFLEGRFAEARELFLVLLVEKGRGDAMIDDLPRAFVEHSLYYLAVCDEALHRDEEARAALHAFLTRSTVEDEARYRDAEARLVRLGGAAAPACASRAELAFDWRRAR
jgi:hypothetical protein